MRALLVLHILILTSAAVASRVLHAQEEPRFSPPRPVISDPADFDDPGEDDAEFGAPGDFPRPGMPPPLPQGNGIPPPAPNFQPPAVNQAPVDFMPSAGGRDVPGKLHFKVVQGVFWHKGMKRTVKHPAEEETSTPSSSSSDNFANPPPMMDGAPPPPDMGDPNQMVPQDDPSQF